MTDSPHTALSLVAAWSIQAAMYQYRADDLRAVGFARLGQLLALPGVERDLLIRLLLDRSPGSWRLRPPERY